MTTTIKQYVRENWKTTLGGLLMSIGVVLQTTSLETATPWLGVIGGVLLAGGGLLTGVAAKDATKNPKPE